MLEYIIVHHTGGTNANPKADSSNYTVKQCDADHKARGFGKSKLGYYVGYTFFIDKQGVVTQTREVGEEGAHTIGKNKTSIGICLAGNFDVTLPTDAQVASLRRLLLYYTKSLNISPDKIVPHRNFASKSCYGTKLSERWARELLKTGVPEDPKALVKKKIREHLKEVDTLLESL